MTARIAVLASGGGTNLQAILDFNARQQAAASGEVVLVASNLESAGALRRARAAGVSAEHFEAADDGSALLELLKRYAIELVVLAGYLKRVPPIVIDAFDGRILNIHPALLPAFGGAGMYGAKVHSAVIASGATTTGVTVHLVNNDFDSGPIIAQWRVSVKPNDTPESLAHRVLAVEHQLYPRVVDMVAALNSFDHFAHI